MEFSSELLNNRVTADQPLTFDQNTEVEIEGKKHKLGAERLPSGDIRISIYAPNASEIVAKTQILQIELKRTKEGIFTGNLPYLRNQTGIWTIDILVDGDLFLYPYLPIYWTNNRPCNFIEVPDERIDFSEIRDVPHGAMTRQIYWAKSLNTWERCTVYTPPGYMKGTEEYPVLYLLNGGSDNETSWQYSGRVNYILDNLIASGECKPFIVVMNNGMLRYPETHGKLLDDAYEKMLCESCIPFIEENFRVKTDKWSRAIGGLSMGAYMTCDIGFNHPDLFGCMGTFTACMTHENFPTTYERPFNRVLSEGAESFGEKYRVFYCSTTTQEDHYDYFEADEELCSNAGINKLPCYVRKLYPYDTSKWNSWRMGIRDYAKLLFR